MRISDWSSYVCSSDLGDEAAPLGHVRSSSASRASSAAAATFSAACFDAPSPSASASLPILTATRKRGRSEEHTSELQSLMRISYAVFCLKKKKKQNTKTNTKYNTYQTHK